MSSLRSNTPDPDDPGDNTSGTKSPLPYKQCGLSFVEIWFAFSLQHNNNRHMDDSKLQFLPEWHDLTLYFAKYAYITQ